MYIENVLTQSNIFSEKKVSFLFHTKCYTSMLHHTLDGDTKNVGLYTFGRGDLGIKKFMVCILMKMLIFMDGP